MISRATIRIFLLFLATTACGAGKGQSVAELAARADSLARAIDPAAGAEWAPDWADEEAYAGVFRPAADGNASYLPMGQLARGLIGLRYRARGLDGRYQRYEINGAEVDNRTEGFLPWQLLTAVQLLPRAHADVGGLGIGRSGPGGVGGITALSTGDRYLPRNTRLSYALTNRSYRHRATASTRLELPRDWSLSVAGSYRGGEDSFVRGVFSDLAHGAFSVTKRYDKQTFTLTAAGVSGSQGVRSAATAEVYTLAGTNYYNPNTGTLGGTLHNGKTRGYRQALGVLSWEGAPRERWTLRAALSVVAGESRFGQPAWYDAASPYPDYYRYLPSFFYDPAVASLIRDEWRAGNPAVSGVDWAKLQEANRLNPDAEGALRARYILRDRVARQLHPAAAWSFEYRPDDALVVRGGVRGRWERSDYFGRVADLIGADYWLDVDPFLLDDEAGSGARSDVRHPDRRVGVGDRFDYNYRIEDRSVALWAAASYTALRWQGALAVEAGTLGYRRTGFYEKERFGGGLSHGRGARIDLPEYMLKAEAFYTPRLRERLGVRVAAGAVAPTAAEVYVAPEYRHAQVAAPRSETTLGAEALYTRAGPQLRVEAALYALFFGGGVEVRDFYDDLSGAYLNGIATGIDRLHTGVEAGVEWAATPRLTVTGAVAWGYYRYRSDPSVTLTGDSDGAGVLAGAKARATNLQLAGTPQTAALLLAAYRTRSYWRVEAALKYTGHNYVDGSLFRRMDRVLERAASAETRRTMLAQERLEDAVTVGASVSKNFRLRGGHTIGLWINADNVLDNRSIRYTGYEQNRLRRTTGADGQDLLSPFDSKYYYAYGANYYLLISYTF